MHVICSCNSEPSQSCDCTCSRARPKALRFTTFLLCTTVITINSWGSSHKRATPPLGRAQKSSLQPPAAAKHHRFVTLWARRPCHGQMDAFLDCWRCTWLGLHSAPLLLYLQFLHWRQSYFQNFTFLFKKQTNKQTPHTLARFSKSYMCLHWSLLSKSV